MPAQLSLHAHLANEHRELDGLLEQLTADFATGDREVATASYKAFESRVNTHLAFEEQELFPEYALLEPLEVSDLAAEHRAIRARIDELGIGVDLHQTRLAAIRDLAGMLRRHAEREDAMLYRWADRISSDPTRRSRFDQALAHAPQAVVR